MMVRLREYDLQPIEGIWYYPHEQMTLGIERMNPDNADGDYRVIMLAGDDLEYLPGMVIGYLQAGPTSDKWQLWLYSQRSNVTLAEPVKCVATLNAGATQITFDPPYWKVKLRVNFARFLPSVFRGVSVVPEKHEEKLPLGFVKRYPEAGDSDHFNKIRYL